MLLLQQVTDEVAAHLKDGGVTVKPYDAMLDDVRQLASSGQKLWADPAKVSSGMFASSMYTLLFLPKH